MKDISWSVNFEIIVDGEEKRWDDLSDTAKEFILNCIKEDSYSGIFID